MAPGAPARYPGNAFNAFFIRGLASNIPFQAALVQHPRFVSGIFTTAFIADEYPNGFVAADWLFGELVFRGSGNGQPICMQLERAGLEYRISHFGKQVRAVVMTAKAERLLALMPVKAPARAWRSTR